MPDNVFYVFDNNRRKVEGMTKEQIINAIAEATGHTPQHVDEGFITTIVETNKNRSLHFWFGTKAEYEAITTKANNTFYIFSDDTDIDDMQADIEELQQAVEQIGDIEIDIQNMEADVNALDARVTAAEAHVDEAVEDVEEAVEAVETMQSDVVQLQTDVDNAEADITALQNTTGGLRTDVNQIGGETTQLRDDVNLLQQYMIDLLPVVRKYNQIMLNQQVQPDPYGGLSIQLLGTYEIKDYDVVKVQFVPDLAVNCEVLCNVWHNGNATRITGTYFDTDGFEFYCINLTVNENTNILTRNNSRKVDDTDWIGTGLTINKIIGVA